MFLDKSTFSTIIKNTPLISIDLIIRNQEDKILLGKRVNRPAQNMWFEPGGRIYKDESIEEAFKRITKDEIGQSYEISKATFLGIYQHMYDDNVFGDEFSTHYIVLVFELKISEQLDLVKVQHNKYKWFEQEELMKSNKVHKYVKEYFTKGKGLK